MGVAGGGPCAERDLLVRCKRRGYTHKKSQTFENKRHLFPLPGPSGVWTACAPIVFPVPRRAATILLEFPGAAPRVSAALISTDRSGSNLVACRFGGGGTSLRGIRAPAARRVSSRPSVRVHYDAGRTLHGAAKTPRPRRRRILRARGLRLGGAARAAHAASVGGGRRGNRDLAQPVSRDQADRSFTGNGKRP